MIPFHPLTNFEISEYYKNEPRFSGVYSRDNLPKTIKKGAYVLNLDEYKDIGTHWITLYVQSTSVYDTYVKTNEVIYFDSFGVEHIPKEIKKFIGNKDIKASIFRLQASDSIMCGYFCIEFINYMFDGKSLIDFSSLFSPHDLKKMIKLLNKYLNMSDINLELNEITKFRLDEITKIKEYFNNEIKERKDIINKINKYMVAFDYADKAFITLSASFGTLSIASHATVVGIPVGIAGASLTLIFTVTTGVVKKLLSVTKKKKKERNKIMVLARNKLNIVETLLSRAFSDFDISQKKFAKIIDEKVKCEKN